MIQGIKFPNDLFLFRNISLVFDGNLNLFRDFGIKVFEPIFKLRNDPSEVLETYFWSFENLFQSRGFFHLSKGAGLKTVIEIGVWIDLFMMEKGLELFNLLFLFLK